MNHISFRASEDQVRAVACGQEPNSLGQSEGGFGPQRSCDDELKQRPGLQGTALAVVTRWEAFAAVLSLYPEHIAKVK